MTRKKTTKRKKTTVITSPMLLWLNRGGEALNWLACGTWFTVTCLTIVLGGGVGWLGAASTCVIHGAIALVLRHMRAM